MPSTYAPARIIYPGGLVHALCLSWDDGQEYDRRLVGILDGHGIPATFHLVSAMIDHGDQRFRFVVPDEIATLYARHEVAAHCRHHASAQWSHPERWIADLLDDRRRLEALSGRLVRGAAWPGGAAVGGLDRVMSGIGIDWCRTVGSGNTSIPDDGRWHHWDPTCTWAEAETRLAPFLANRGGGVFMAWGHSYELERDDGWNRVDRLATAWAAAKAWRATCGEIYDYITAWRRLRWSANGCLVHNPNAITVWYMHLGKVDSVRPGAMASLAAPDG